MRTLVPLLAALLALFAQPLPAQDGDPSSKVKEQELLEVRERISALKRQMDARAAERDRVTTELQAAEVEIAEQRQQLAELERRQAASERRRQELEAREAALQRELEAEARALARQVRAAYVSGSQERLKLLLNQQDPAQVGRQLVYYRYLSEFRGANIASMTARLAELVEVRDGIAAEVDRLARLARARYAELTKLSNAQDRRRELLAQLNRRLSEEGAELARLAEQERDLARLIEELTRILSDYPITAEEPFSSYKGRLTWPVSGRLLHDFGQPRAGGGLQWNGVVLAAPRGREVRAVYHGRVVFADWLAGMGLLVIVDHGDGYLSLYGYNESILANAGDWVAPGDVLATVGDSGGQQQSSLYFEIRRGTNPQNPRDWVSRQPQR